MNRGTFQGVFAFFFIFLLGRNVRRGQGEGTGILPRELRFAAKRLYELCFWFSMPDETVATRPPWLDSSLPRRPCRCISVYRSIILQTLNSFAIRSQGSTCTLAVAAAYVPYVVAKLLQMMLLNYTCLNYASLNLRFAYTGMQACIDDTF